MKKMGKYRRRTRNAAITIISALMTCIVLSLCNIHVVKASEEEDNKKAHKSTGEYVDLGNTNNEENNCGTLIKERDRTDLYYRLYFEQVEAKSVHVLKYGVFQSRIQTSGCRVRQGIFYYRLQSDDDEDPGSSTDLT